MGTPTDIRTGWCWRPFIRLVLEPIGLSKELAWPPSPALMSSAETSCSKSVPGASTFTIAHSGNQMDTYTTWESGGNASTGQPTFSWSQNSSLYHYTTCRYVRNVAPHNLQTANTAPANKQLHTDCPK